jgi:hypothetical protein
MSINQELISPCGMNCAICSGYLANKYDVKSQGIRMPYCAGCRPRNKQCAFLKRRCELLLNSELQYCFQCDEFPCQHLERLDKRYAANFRMSMIENLKNIKHHGIAAFLTEEETKWACPQCGALRCCHNGICFNCNLDVLKDKKKLYRWEDD